MSKLKLSLNDSDLRTVQHLLLAAIRRNPVDYLRKNPADFLIVAELSAIYNKVETKVRDLEWFGSTRSTVGKIVSLTLTRPEAAALYILLTEDDDTELPVLEDEVPILPFEDAAMVITYEADFVRRLFNVIHRQYFI